MEGAICILKPLSLEFPAGRLPPLTGGGIIRRSFSAGPRVSSGSAVEPSARPPRPPRLLLPSLSMSSHRGTQGISDVPVVGSDYPASSEPFQRQEEEGGACEQLRSPGCTGLDSEEHAEKNGSHNSLQNGYGYDAYGVEYGSIGESFSAHPSGFRPLTGSPHSVDSPPGDPSPLGLSPRWTDPGDLSVHSSLAPNCGGWGGARPAGLGRLDVDFDDGGGFDEEEEDCVLMASADRGYAVEPTDADATARSRDSRLQRRSSPSGVHENGRDQSDRSSDMGNYVETSQPAAHSISDKDQDNDAPDISAVSTLSGGTKGLQQQLRLTNEAGGTGTCWHLYDNPFFDKSYRDSVDIMAAGGIAAK